MKELSGRISGGGGALAFTRYCVTIQPYHGSHSLFYRHRPPAKHTPLQYYCTTIAQYTPPPPTPPLNVIHHTIFAMGISSKGQRVPLPIHQPRRAPATNTPARPTAAGDPQLGLYKIFVYFEAAVHDPTILSPPPPPALPTLVQYYCTIIGQYTTPPPTSRLYAIHHTILVITISCKGQPTAPPSGPSSRRRLPARVSL